MLCAPVGLAIFWQALGLHQNKNVSWKKKALTLIAFSVGANLVAYYWIPFTLQEFGGLFFPFNYLLWMIFSLLIFPQYWLLLLLAFLGRTKWAKLKQWKLPLLLLALVLSEHFCPTLFPAHAGHPWMNLAPWIRLAPYGGLPFYSLLTYALSFLLGLAIFQKRLHHPLLWGCLLMMAAHFFAPPLQKAGPEKTVQVRVVQANVGNFLKLQSEDGNENAIEQILGWYERLSTSELSGTPDLIIWPETAYPFALSTERMRETDRFTPAVFKKIQKEVPSFMLFGGYSHNLQADLSNLGNNFELVYNSALLLNPQGRVQEVYHKQKLIPFGETLPFGKLNPYLGRWLQNISYFARGSRFPQFFLPEKASFAVFICYELLFTEYVRQELNGLKERPYFLVNLTNDSWYGDTAQPRQHLWLAHWRALELNLPIIRSTNTGLSAVLYPDGSLSKIMGVGKREFLDEKMAVAQTLPTFYQKFGVLFTLIFWAAVLVLNYLFYRRKK